MSLIAGVQPGFGLVKIAQTEGFFNDLNVRMDVINRPSGKLAIKSVINREVDADFILVADIAYLANQHKLNNYRIVASVFDSDNQNVLASMIPFDNLNALEGKTVCTQYQSALHFFGQLLADRSGVQDVSFKYLNISELTDALVRGDCDFITTREPFISELLRRPKEEQAYIKHFPGVYLQHELMLAHNRIKSEGVTKVLSALIRAEELFVSDVEKADSILIDTFNVSPARLQALKYDSLWEVSLYQPMIPLLERQMDWLVSLGVTEGKGYISRLSIRAEELGSIAPMKQTVVRNEN